MNEKTSNTGKPEGVERLELISLGRDVLHRLKRFWWVVILLTALFAALFYYRSSTTYSARYVAEATVSVEIVNGGQYANQTTAEQMGIVFPYILTSGALSDVIASDLGTNGVPGSITVTSIRGTNLLTIDVTANDPNMAYNILQSVLKNYPEVARFVVGQTRLSVIDDSGIPVDTGRTSVLRGSTVRGALIGLALSMVLLVLYTLSTRTIRGEAELRELLNIPCFGSLPLVRRKRRTQIISSEINMLVDRNCEDYVEAMRLIRTRLERQLGTKKVLMITSSIPGEGKSTVAANLAISFAQKGKKVVLVDCDLRNPSQTSIFNIPDTCPGLASVLKGETRLEDSLVEVKNQDKPIGLTVLCGGDKKSRSVEIMGSEAMGDLIADLRDQADMILLDTPPSAMLVDAMILARHVDGVLYVVMNDYAKRRFIYKGIEELADNAVPVVGCLLNGAHGSVGRYGRYGSYGYYGHYGRYGYSGYYGRYSRYGYSSYSYKSKDKSGKEKTGKEKKNRKQS